MTGRIGLFGGTFNPVHSGHIHAAGLVRDLFGLDRVLLIPSFIPPHKDAGEIAPARDRLRMVELACEGRPGLVASAIEVEAGETSYSVITLGKIRALHPESRLFFILGIDAFLEIPTWRDCDRLLRENRFIVMARPGRSLAEARGIQDGRWAGRIVEVGEGETPGEETLDRFGIFLVRIRALDVSSTEIRRLVRSGRDPGDLVPPAVGDYIRTRGLYRRKGGT